MHMGLQVVNNLKLFFSWGKGKHEGNRQWISFGDHPIELERCREDEHSLSGTSGLNF